MKKFILLFSLISFPVIAQQGGNSPEVEVQNQVATSIGNFYMKVVQLGVTVDLQKKRIDYLQTELDKCHKEGCKQEVKAETKK